MNSAAAMQHSTVHRTFIGGAISLTAGLVVGTASFLGFGDNAAQVVTKCMVAWMGTYLFKSIVIFFHDNDTLWHKYILIQNPLLQITSHIIDYSLDFSQNLQHPIQTVLWIIFDYSTMHQNHYPHSHHHDHHRHFYLFTVDMHKKLITSSLIPFHRLSTIRYSFPSSIIVINNFKKERDERTSSFFFSLLDSLLIHNSL
ncbi:hypothetical protein BDA99DRAFT_514042 [Phascolomyces articulosus]|uniref:Uncharacterized protein n=1 Tax=Phascolomyces articulosus TaxID=60185 RepID=A0AAD5K6S2_9FUNG|nr:hypothetical protein BDA99DRAFT_514042 [Phascolomyces articulosus]